MWGTCHSLSAWPIPLWGLPSLAPLPGPRPGVPATELTAGKSQPSLIVNKASGFGCDRSIQPGLSSDAPLTQHLLPHQAAPPLCKPRCWGTQGPSLTGQLP